jgi:pimeloyl-ACP methyl ester carboxylesterase
MKNYILVHGAWGNAQEFDAVVKLLSEDGSRVTAIDLPGHGGNRVAIADVTMDAYIQKVVNEINGIEGKVILIGHSLAGFVISNVAEAIPEKIDRLIYIAAMLPKNGDVPLALMQSDKDGELLAEIIFSEDESYATLEENTIRSILLHDVKDQEHLNNSIPLFYMKQATQPFMAVAKLSEPKFGSVPKYYIRATKDKVLSPSLQDEMLANWKVDKVSTLTSGHFPLTSIPAGLVTAIKAFDASIEELSKVA